MGHNWSVVTDKIYGIVKGSCKKLTMYDKAGNETIDPDDATRFFGTLASHNPKLDNFAILVALHDRGQYSYINIKTPNLKDDVDFKKVHQIRNHIRKSVGQKEGIKVVWQVFDKEIDPKEEAVNNIKESKDVGKWFGTTKSSFQRIGEAKLIIRHTDAINEEKTGARTRHIRALFVENKTGERFAYPHLHMSGARAFARHISNGGTNYDSIAEGIISLSADYISLRRAAHTMRQHQVVSDWTVGVRKSMDGINRRLTSLHGSKGYSNAESILASQSMVLDEQSTDSLWQKLSEECSCGQEEPEYNNLGVAAKYLSGVDNQPKPITFTWNRRPNVSDVPDGHQMLERLHWQISELADACADPHASARLSEIAKMIAADIKPTQQDLELVREAIASSINEPQESILPEEAELERFLNEFTTESIFAEADDPTDDEVKELYCSNCGGKFAAKNGRRDGFSHCKNHKGFTPLSESTEDKTDDVDEGYQVMRPMDKDRYQERSGLEGPFMTKSGKVVYYDPKEGKYYDPDSDFYIDYDDYAAMNTESMDKNNNYSSNTTKKHKFRVYMKPIIGRRQSFVNRDEPEAEKYAIEPVEPAKKPEKLLITVPATNTSQARTTLAKYLSKNFGQAFILKIEYVGVDDNVDEDDAYGEPTKDDIIWCSNCGERFHGNGRKHGFSHCENHKGFKMIYETLVTDDENVDEGDAYGVAQKDRERKEEIAYNKEQRAKRWNFGEPIKDDTAADSDLEEDTADENINEGWSIAKPIDTDRYQSRAGLEGPFMTKVGKVVYYDPKEGKYYDPDSDFYIDYDDYAAMNEESSVGSDNPCHVCDGSGTHRGKTCRLCDGSGLSSAGHHSVEEAESDIRFIPGVPGEAILKIGNYYLVWDRDRYESRTVKNEYDVYQQTGDTFKHIENLNMPYDPPGHATAMFIKKYSHMTESENIKRIKHLAGI